MLKNKYGKKKIFSHYVKHNKVLWTTCVKYGNRLYILSVTFASKLLSNYCILKISNSKNILDHKLPIIRNVHNVLNLYKQIKKDLRIICFEEKVSFIFVF